MQIQLTRGVSDVARGDAVGWFLAGNNPRAWIDELARWGMPFQSVELRVIPCSVRDATPIGVLVTCGLTQSHLPKFDSLAVPYRCLVGRLFVPVDSKFTPAVNATEIIALLPDGDSQFVWHPSAGLVRFESCERLRVFDLIRPTIVRRPHWDRAVPGIAHRSRLLSVEPAEPPSAEQVLHAAGDGIGGDRESLEKLPPAPGEGLAGTLHEWTKPLRNAWKRLTRRPPAQPPASPSGSKSGSGKTAGAGGGLAGWLGAAAAPLVGLAAAGASLVGKMIPRSVVDQAARLREIDRLMHLLKSDPDSGLRYALPMGLGSAPRGIASPSNQLGLRDTNFGLGRLFSGGPVDAWQIPPNQQFQLIAMYRELAAREVRMGRHRRAAYIFGELLGDVLGAATTLESGGHFRDAAILFRNKLNRPHDAARCLESGGFLDEAAELFVELGQFEKAADLYIRLQRPEEAERLLRNWVQQLTHEGHYVRASEILQRKLHDVDNALTVLDTGWNQAGPAADACVDRLFLILSDTGRHELATQRVGALRDSKHEITRTQSVTRALSAVATNYVDLSVREQADDATRVVVARRLPSASPPESKQLLASIRTLAPQDRLLTRDCDRFIKQREFAARRQTAGKPARASGLSLIKSFKLEGRDIHWRAAKATSEALYVVGHWNGGLTLRRVPWSNTVIHNQNAFWANVSEDRRILFDLGRTGHGQRHVMVHALGAEPLGLRGLLTESALPSQNETAGSPAWACASTLALACSNGVPYAWRVRAFLDTIELTGFNQRGDVVTAGSLGISSAATLNDVPVTISSSVTPIRIGVGRVLCRPIFSDSPDRYVQLESDIESLDSYRDNLVDCVVALFDVGGVVIREPVHDNQPQPIAEGMESPCGSFLQGGKYVGANRRECRVYSLDQGYPRQIAMTSLDSPAIAVTRTDSLGQFAVVGSDGQVQLFTVTS